MNARENKEEFDYCTIGTIYSVISTFRWFEKQRSRQSPLLSVHSVFTRGNLVPMNTLFYYTSVVYLRKSLTYSIRNILSCSFLSWCKRLCLGWCAALSVWRLERQTWRESVIPKIRVQCCVIIKKKMNPALAIACYAENQSMISQFIKSIFASEAQKMVYWRQTHPTWVMLDYVKRIWLRRKLL